MNYRRQRVRDPLHNLVEFRAEEFENVMWEVLQTRPFQRLRRIKQLGFSEMVYPGATHTRFAHSIGVFHTARKLMGVIEEHLGEKRYQSSRSQVALAAALVHDLGHGPFSHAFEDVGKRFSLRLAGRHERISDLLIRQSDVSKALNTLGSGFANDVAAMIESERPQNIYSAVVSSQFDADRLDYMRRDRLMTGTHHGGIDFDWLLSNIEIGEVSFGIDEESLGTLETFVLGPKAAYAAEAYLLGLFQLYPTVYFHKTTRGAEKLFTEILARIIELTRDDSVVETGLGESHPLIRFARDPDNIDNILNLDDTVLWGSLSLMTMANDSIISDYSTRLRDRKLFKCYDLIPLIARELKDPGTSKHHESIVMLLKKKIEEWIAENRKCSPHLLLDFVKREPYKRFQDSKGPLNQILLNKGDGKLVDVATLSNVVAAITPFVSLRLYAPREDKRIEREIQILVNKELKNASV